MAFDPYAILGINPGASPAEVKQAYRRLARENHPDRNPDDPGAEERFKAAAEAYRQIKEGVVSHQYSSPPSSSSHSTAEDLFEEVFGKRRTHTPSGARRWGVRERGSDLKYTLELTLEELSIGGEKLIRVPGEDHCKRCGGIGAEPGSSPLICHSCGGTGRQRSERGFFRNSSCPACNGEGKINPKNCQACEGTGRVKLSREIPVPIPAGAVNGTRLKVSGEGLPGSGGETAGDLFVELQTLPHDFLEREGADLEAEVPVSFVTATLGGHVYVPTLEGRVRMRVPAGSSSGRVFRLRNKGLPRGDGTRGDQRVYLLVEVPSELSENAQALLRELQAELEGEPSQSCQYQQRLDEAYRD